MQPSSFSTTVGGELGGVHNHRFCTKIDVRGAIAPFALVVLLGSPSAQQLPKKDFEVRKGAFPLFAVAFTLGQIDKPGTQQPVV